MRFREITAQRATRFIMAADAFSAALECECSEPERRFLARRLQLCGA